uniref:Uncharacterized protein LOC100181668 n=1 Tax=Phallusia mammillata TaxID=59560 RepID=A0A6F9DHJ1_9ASCI|nr:uncharacterized protein LOC100181668 [Phallusia mammillata]
MPRYCKVKAQDFSENDIVSKTYESGCEFIIPYLGIDPGSDDEDGSILEWLGNALVLLLDPNSCWFQVFILLATTLVAFALGIYIR